MIDIQPAVTVEEAADCLGVETWTVREMILQGELPAVHVDGGEYWIKNRELYRYIQERKQQSLAHDQRKLHP